MPDLAPAPGRLPEGQRIYAVGDVHGCADRLAALHGLIAADLAARPVAAPLLVHLGDYVDKARGGEAVLELLTCGPLPPLPMICLMGNHDRMMRDALTGDAGAASDWLWCGGRQTLADYGTAPESGWRGWAEAVPPHHQRFLASGLALSHRAGGYLFVHAGIRPGVALEAQVEEDLLTIRGPFLHSEADHGVVVVHGHTARPAPEIRRNRIGLDTAAWSGGKLTCAVLEADRMGFLAV